MLFIVLLETKIFEGFHLPLVFMRALVFTGIELLSLFLVSVFSLLSSCTNETKQ